MLFLWERYGVWMGMSLLQTWGCSGAHLQGPHSPGVCCSLPLSLLHVHSNLNFLLLC